MFAIAAVFAFAVLVFVLYDMMVERRQKKILDTAKKSTAIVSSIFPKKVRDQLLGAPVQGNATKLRRLAGGATPMGQSTKKLEDASQHSCSDDLGSPIADLFPDCTVMFADVEGFTAWSSVREPSQVFVSFATELDVLVECSSLNLITCFSSPFLCYRHFWRPSMPHLTGLPLVAESSKWRLLETVM